MDTMGDVEGLDVVGDVDGDDVVGARSLALRGRGGLRLPSALRGASTQGISSPREELDYLTFPALTIPAGSTTGSLISFPQRPFRGERVVMTATLIPGTGSPSDVSGFTTIDPAIYVGAIQVGASQGAAPLSAFAATAFGVRLAFPPAGQGTRVFIPIVYLATIGTGDSVVVTATIFGRGVR